jgi:hypothetical protein
MLFQESIDLLGAPQVVVDLARLCLAYCRELDYSNVSICPSYPSIKNNILFSELNFVESMVLLKTFTANPQASFKSHSSL